MNIYRLKGFESNATSMSADGGDHRHRVDPEYAFSPALTSKHK
jgi:hypothetical protein